MSRKSAKKEKERKQKNPANIPAPLQDTASMLSVIPPARGDTEEFCPTSSETLRPVCPDPEQGFQPLSKYWVDCITEKVMVHLKRICKEHGIRLDLKYWKHATRQILKQPDLEETIIVPAPAGSGKSTWIQAFALALTELLQNDSTLNISIVGLVIVMQKVEDLNNLAAVVNQGADEDHPNMVALQGWTVNAQQMGFCQNFDVNTFEECNPSTCPCVESCKLIEFEKMEARAPILGMTQERFYQLRRKCTLESALSREFTAKDIGRSKESVIREKGPPTVKLPRRYLFFDEKIEMAQVDILDMDLIQTAIKECTRLGQNELCSDLWVRSLQQRISFLFLRPFQELRARMCFTEGKRKYDIQTGIFSLEPDDPLLEKKEDYFKFQFYTIKYPRLYPVPSLHEIFPVMDQLYAGDPCFFSKTNGFAISSIRPPKVQYGQSQSIIFDATAEVDPDYSDLDQVHFMDGRPERTDCDILFHIFDHPDMNVTRRAMKKNWKIPALSQLVATCTQDAHEDIFICTYKNQAEILANTLQSDMSPESFQHVLLMPNKERPTIPYLGGTNGSNIFNTATTVFMLGYPRLNPSDYLLKVCAEKGIDVMRPVIDTIPPEKLIARNLEILYSIPYIKAYIAGHLAARLEQEIYRCALRNPDFDGQIHVYLFCPPEDMLELLQKRMPGEIDWHDELPSYVELLKSTERNYGSNGTSFSRLSQFLKTWDGASIRVKDIQKQLEISPAVWKDLIADSRTKELFQQYGVQRSGRGPNAAWAIPGKDCA